MQDTPPNKGLERMVTPLAARAGWSLTSERIAKNPDGLELPALMDRIESGMGTLLRRCNGR